MRVNPFLRSVDVILEFDELKLEAAVEYNGAGPVLSDYLRSAEEFATARGSCGAFRFYDL